MKKILVVYYSRTGVTRKLAKTIADFLDADREELIDLKNRKGILGYLGAGKDAALKRQTQLQDIVYDPSTYDVVLIGTPIWDFTMSAAVRTYITLYEKKFPSSIAFFCTQASSGAKETIHEMSLLCGRKPLGSIFFTSKEISKNNYQDIIKSRLVESRLLAG